MKVRVRTLLFTGLNQRVNLSISIFRLPVPLFSLTLFLSAILIFSGDFVRAEDWRIRGSTNSVIRESNGRLKFANGVIVDREDHSVQIILPNAQKLVINRTPHKKDGMLFISKDTAGHERTESLDARQSRDFTWVILDSDKVVINQKSPGAQKDFLSLLQALLVAHIDNQTLAIIDLYQANHPQSINALPSHIQNTLYKILSFHGVTPPKKVITNIFTTEQLIKYWENQPDANTQNASRQSKHEKESPKVLARLNTDALPLSKTPAANPGPACCCPDAADGNTSKKKIVYYSPGTFQGDLKKAHHSYDRMKETYKDSPCVEIIYNFWSAWSCIKESSKALAAKVSETLNSGEACSVDMVGYSGGGTMTADAATQIARNPGVTAPVHVTTLGSPFAGTFPWSEAAWLVQLAPPPFLFNVGELTGIAPCGARQLAQGYGVAAPTDPLTTMELVWSSRDSWVPEFAATTGGPTPNGHTVEYRNVVHRDHDEIIDDVIHTFEWNNCCGNGTKEAGEDCEPQASVCSDSNGRPALCTASCKCPVLCGNGVREIKAYPGGHLPLGLVALGEECDPPNERSVHCPGPTRWELGYCDNMCHCRPPGCGNGETQRDLGEECEKDIECEIHSPGDLVGYCDSKCKCQTKRQCVPEIPGVPRHPDCEVPGDPCPNGGECDWKCQCPVQSGGDDRDNPDRPVGTPTPNIGELSGAILDDDFH